MKFYEFYSDFYDKHRYKKIPKNVLDDTNYNYKPIPEKYRFGEKDYWITDVEGLLPEDFDFYKAIHLWYSENNKKWIFDFYWTDDKNKIQLVNEKYIDTFKSMSKPPKVMYKLYRTLIIASFIDDYDELKEYIHEVGDIHFNNKPLGYDK